MPFQKGHKGYKYWKGKKFTEEHKRKIKESRRSYIGKNNPFYGKKHSEETKKKLRKSHKGKKFTEEHKKNISFSLLKNPPNKGKKVWHSGRTNVYSKETLEKMREAHKGRNKGKHLSPKTEFKKGDKILIERRAKQIIPIRDTKIEVKIQNFLTLLHIEYFTHKYISEITHSYQCDILIPSTKTIIECDGCYWHGCPICKKLINKRIQKQIEDDKRRTQELQNKGYNVIRLWEHEINKMSIKEFEKIKNSSLASENTCF